VCARRDPQQPHTLECASPQPTQNHGKANLAEEDSERGPVRQEAVPVIGGHTDSAVLLDLVPTS
jgi:hypothetical protein